MVSFIKKSEKSSKLSIIFDDDLQAIRSTNPFHPRQLLYTRCNFCRVSRFSVGGIASLPPEHPASVRRPHSYSLSLDDHSGISTFFSSLLQSSVVSTLCHLLFLFIILVISTNNDHYKTQSV